MNEKNLALLEQYDLQVKGFRRGRGAYVLDTDQGLKLFTEFSGTERRLLFQNRLSKLCRLLFLLCSLRLLWPLLLLWPYPFHSSAFRSFIFPFGDSLILPSCTCFPCILFSWDYSLELLFLFFLSLHCFSCIFTPFSFISYRQFIPSLL